MSGGSNNEGILVLSKSYHFNTFAVAGLDTWCRCPNLVLIYKSHIFLATHLDLPTDASKEQRTRASLPFLGGRLLVFLFKLGRAFVEEAG
jgi:hypothetical protein